MAALTYFGAHFAVLGHASSERTSYKAMHRWAFYVGISLAGLLTLGAVLTATATVREAGGLMAVGFLCFALVFCALVQVAFWSFCKPTQVEDAVLDTYDLVYDQAVKSSSSIWRQELAAIQDTFLCCGKSSPFSLLGSSEADLCRGAEAERQVRRGAATTRAQPQTSDVSHPLVSPRPWGRAHSGHREGCPVIRGLSERGWLGWVSLTLTTGPGPSPGYTRPHSPLTPSLFHTASGGLPEARGQCQTLRLHPRKPLEGRRVVGR
uniref:Tetraspanin 32 n=1 Tax=Equus caballus TaxID=9796 RepID=A0A9L0TIW6_HORSE